jgi:hypothetical protein
MSKVTYQSYTNTALDAKGIADDVAYAGGGYVLTTNGAADNLGHLITILGNTATDQSGKTFTVTGTDANDRPMTEGIAGPNGNVTVTTTKYFKTVTSVTVSATTGAETFDIGWTAAAVGAEIALDYTRDPVINTGVFCRVPSGTPGYGLEFTGDATPAGLDSTSWLAHATIAGKTATFAGAITTPVLAIRLKFSTAGPVNMTVIEPFRS